MAKYRFDQIAINSTEKKKPVEADRFTYLGLEHLDSGTLKVTRFGSEVAPIGEKLVMHKGDVLFGKRRAYQKKVAIAPFDGIFSAHGMVLRPKENVIDKDFFPLFISSDYFLDAAIKISVGSLSPTINWRDLKELEFELPDMDSQRKLAEVLWSINDTMEAYKKLISATDELVKSQFIELFSKEKGWPLVKLKALCDSIVRGPFGSTLKVNFFVEKGPDTVKVYEQKNAIQRSAVLGDSYVTKAKYQELKRFECGPGDFIMSCSGTIGCLYQLPNDAELGIINQVLCKFHLNEKMLPEVFLTYMKNSVDQLETKGSGIKNIGAVSYIKNMEIALPPLLDQEQFAVFVRQSDKSKFELEQALSELTATYKRIIAENLG